MELKNWGYTGHRCICPPICGGAFFIIVGAGSHGDRQITKLHAGYAMEIGSVLDRKEKMQRGRSQSRSDICRVILLT